MKRFKWLIPAVLVIVLLFLLGRRVAGFVPAFSEWVKSLGPLGPAAFIAGFIVATVAFVPGSILTLAGGALFGIVRGTIIVFIGATLGATCAFLVSRYVARGFVVRRMSHMPRFVALDKAVQREGRKIVFLLRLSPAVPFNFINYALGVTAVHLRDYVIACIGMFPVVLLWVYYGHVIGNVAGVLAGRHPPRGPGYWIILIAGLIATVVVTAIITRAAQRALSNSMEDVPE